MKKFILSAFVILSFAAYSIQKKLAVDVTNTPLTPVALQTDQNPALPVVTPTPVISPPQPPTPTPATPTPAPAPVPALVPAPVPTSAVTNTGKYKNGIYTGDVTDAFYGNVQVQVVVAGGKITEVKFLDYPHDRNTSREINSQATPMLSQEAISAQSAKVDIVSGATATSEAFIQSLQTALDKAANNV